MIQPLPPKPREMTDLEISILATAIMLEQIGMKRVRVQILPIVK